MDDLRVTPGFDTQHPCPDCGAPFVMTATGQQLVPQRLVGAPTNGRQAVEGRAQGVWAYKICLWCLRRERYVADRETKQWQLAEVIPGNVPAPAEG